MDEPFELGSRNEKRRVKNLPYSGPLQSSLKDLQRHPYTPALFEVAVCQTFRKMQYTVSRRLVRQKKSNQKLGRVNGIVTYLPHSSVNAVPTKRHKKRKRKQPASSSIWQRRFGPIGSRADKRCMPLERGGPGAVFVIDPFLSHRLGDLMQDTPNPRVPNFET